jgi:hypothetical protein
MKHVRVFSSYEYQRKGDDGSWHRDLDRSTLSVERQIADWVNAQAPLIEQVSPPSIQLYREEGGYNLVIVGVTVVYCPSTTGTKDRVAKEEKARSESPVERVGKPADQPDKATGGVFGPPKSTGSIPSTS